jgi:acylphosphatase
VARAIYSAAVSAVRKRVVVAGLVQGVFFREWTRRTAERRGVAGWVRNCPDGTVEAVFEGSPSDVASLVESVGLGPPDARVSSVESHDEEPQGLQGFLVH